MKSQNQNKMPEETPLSVEIKKFHAECLDQATTPDEDMLIKTIFGFIKGMNKEAVERLNKEINNNKWVMGLQQREWISSVIDKIFGEFK